MLVSEVVDRCYSEWIYPGGTNLPAVDVVATVGTALGGTNNGDFTVEGLVSNIPDSTILEIEDELILTKSVSGTTVTTLQRGYLETTAASHAVGTPIYLNPKFSRITLFNALKTVIGTLYPLGMYVRSTDNTIDWDWDDVVSLPSGTEDVLSLIVRHPGSNERYTAPLMEGRDYRVLYEFTPPKLEMMKGGFQGNEVTVVVKKDFTLPTAFSDDLTTLGLPESIQPVLPMAMAGYILQGRELPRTMIEEVRRTLASQGVQVGASVNIGQLLIQTFERRYVANERMRLKEKDPLRYAIQRS